MDITEKRQVSEDQRVFVEAVRWDEATPIELLGTGSQAAQLYPSDIDLFSAVKDVAVTDTAEMYRHIKSVFDRAEDAGDMFFIEFKLQNVDGSKQKWYDTTFDEGEFVNAATKVDFLKVDYVIFIRGRNLFTELSSIYSFSPMPPVRTLVNKIGEDFGMYYREGKVYKALKRMYSIYKLKGKKEKLVELSTLFNSKTGFKYSLSSNLKAIELLLEHYDDYDIQRMVKVNLIDLEKIIGVKIRSSKQMTNVIHALDAQIEKETQEWLNSGHKNVLSKQKGAGRKYRRRNRYGEWVDSYNDPIGEDSPFEDEPDYEDVMEEAHDLLYGRDDEILRLRASDDTMRDLWRRLNLEFDTTRALAPNSPQRLAHLRAVNDLLRQVNARRAQLERNVRPRRG